MSTIEEQSILRRLAQHVSRAFYEPKFVVIMDQLARHPVLKDDDLAGRIGLQAKELNKLLAVLSNDCLVAVHRQNELKEGAQRSVGKQYYYIDYTHFCNVVKWRVAEMRRVIDKTLRNELDTKGYVCPQCKKTFTTLEVDRLMDFMAGTFICDVCQGELIDNEDAEAVRGGKDRMERFNRQMRFILAGLRASEEMVMPRFDVAVYVKQHLVQTDAERQDAADAAGAGGGGRRGDRELRIAGADGTGVKDEGIGVVMSVGIDEDKARAERDKAAEAKKAQNALPAWHLQSTITGDLTALGVAEQARVAATAAQNAAAVSGSNNDDSLRGLGTVQGRMSDVKMESMITISEDSKVALGANDDYDDYYASLAAGTQSRSTPTSGVQDDLGGGDDEDIKPNVEYLDSLNDYRKRARSPAVTDWDGPASKMARAESPPQMEPETQMDITSGDSNDPIVYVNGEAMPFSKVTEEHHELMTPDEYTAYFEVYESQSMM